MGCRWCIPSRRCAPAPSPTRPRPPWRPSCRKRHGRPSSAMRSRASAPPTPPKPSANGSRRPTPRPGTSAPRPHPALPPPPHQEGEGQGQGEGKGHQGALRQEGTEGPQVSACTQRDRAPEETPHVGRKSPNNQEGAGAGTKARRKRAPRQTPLPTPRRGVPRRGTSAAAPRPNAARLPGAHPPTRTAEARIGRRTDHTSAHPPATGNHTGNGGHTYTGRTGHTHRGSRRERRRTAHHHALTARRRPRPPEDPPHRHQKRTKARPRRPGLGTGTPRGHGTKAQAPREGSPTDAYPTHLPERHAHAPTARTERHTHI